MGGENGAEGLGTQPLCRLLYRDIPLKYTNLSYSSKKCQNKTPL